MTGTHLIARDGFRLMAHVSGRGGDAPWIVLSHSVGSSSLMWWPQRALLENHYRVLAYDTRGHGDSDAPDGPYSPDDLVGDVVALMDHFDIERADFMGLSLGGRTGLGLVLAHPHRVNRFICCDARADAPPDVVRGWEQRVAEVEKGGMRAVLSLTMERWFTPAFRERERDAMREIEAMFLATSVTGYKGVVEAIKRFDCMGELGRIRVPTLYVVGAEDTGAPPALVRQMANATPGARYVEIPDAAHVANINNQKAFDAAIANYLGLR